MVVEISVGAGEARAGVAGVGVAVVRVGWGVLTLERLMEERVGRWMGWISEMGGNGLPVEVTVGFGLIDFPFAGADLKCSFSEERL